MRVVLCEWCMSGGLAGADASIAREGRMMLEALAADAAKDAALDVTVLVEAGRALDLPALTRLLAVPAGGAAAAIVAAARDADWTVVVAPETDGILAGVVRAVRAAGGRVLAPDDRVIDVASDKQATVDALAARGLPVPAGRALAAGEPLPAGFHLPAVRKARAGCGGDGLEILAARDAPPASMPTRVEALTEGTPVGVSCLCGSSTPIVLPPMRQRFTAGTAPRYQGSDLLAGAGPIARATALARHAATALGATAGWLGVDMILGERPDGRDDRVLEVNPRVTTSFVGLSRLFASSLVAAMIEAATGTDVAPTLVPVAGSGPSADFRLPDA
ncbi:MAG: ATP-grasp domain-containing protein [Planctomycetaceae bacterium]